MFLRSDSLFCVGDFADCVVLRITPAVLPAATSAAQVDTLCVLQSSSQHCFSCSPSDDRCPTGA